MIIDPRQFYESLKKETLGSLFLFFGEEEYLIIEALNSLTDKILEGAARDFNLDVFYAQVDDMVKVRDAIETLPMMAKQRVVVLREAQHLKAKDFDQLMPVIENPVDSTMFIMVTSQVDQRLKFVKRFSESGTLVKFQKPFPETLPNWITKIALRHGKKLTLEANELLLQIVGSSLIDIDNELRKVSQYLGDRDTANADDIRQVVSSIRVDNVFQLANAIGANDRSVALTCLANLLENGESPLGILALVARHVRILTHVRDGLNQGLSTGQLSSRVGVPSFFIRQYIDQSRHWSESKISRTYSALLQTDRALKSSPVTPHIWLENFIIKTCS